MDHPFRTTAVGGFNREDVLNYLEELTSDHKYQLDDMRAKYDDLLAKNRQAEQDLDRVCSTLRNLQGVVSQREELYEQAQADNEHFQHEIQALKDSLDNAVQEKDDLLKRIEVLETEASLNATTKSIISKTPHSSLGQEMPRAEMPQAPVQQMPVQPVAQPMAQPAAQQPVASVSSFQSLRPAPMTKPDFLASSQMRLAEQMQMETTQWINDVGAMFRDLRSNIQASTQSAVSQLEQSKMLLDELNSMLDAKESEISKVTGGFIQE